LEKIEMKKTLVAVAAMAAVTGAMADVTIGGLIDAGLFSISNTTALGVKTTQRGVGPQNNGTDELFFAASEDLGNGLKANARLGYNANATTAGNNFTNRISYIGVSSASFGELQAGEQWKPGFFAILNLDPTGLVSTSNAGLVGPGDMAAFTANSITYTAPSFNGVGFQYQKGYGEQVGNSGADNSGYRLDYTNGGLYVVYSAATRNLLAADTFSGNTIGGAADALYVVPAGNNTTQVKSNGYGGSYDFGMAKITAGNFSSTVGARSKSGSTAYGLSAPVGPVVVAAVFSNGSTTDNANASVTTKGQRYIGTYSLSKRTSVYAFMGTSTAGTTRKTNESAFGIKHTF